MAETKCFVGQACDILATWQANHASISIVIEDQVGLLHCNGVLRQAGAGTVEISDVQDKVVHLRLTFPQKAIFQYRIAPDASGDFPYETLLTQHLGCTVYIGAYREEPKKSQRLML